MPLLQWRVAARAVAAAVVALTCLTVFAAMALPHAAVALHAGPAALQPLECWARWLQKLLRAGAAAGRKVVAAAAAPALSLLGQQVSWQLELAAAAAATAAAAPATLLPVQLFLCPLKLAALAALCHAQHAA
jgi:hypothetical protein